ncbi:phage antirepressor N-terminal domain-containing protein [Sebaldella termitidis]|uniref:phage antirepressor N-terminal domain-containing protein n=1 Tax=Sebaldella termitidis TaxID=826 RepID=UPI003EB9BBE4
MELIKKEIEFNSDKIFTVMKDGKLYVGVSNICLNLGMSKNMKDRQSKNVQSDLVLSRGCVKFDAGVFDQYNQTLAIELEYLPIWLAKIRVTPNMLEEKKELVEKLIDYQLHCKDILADEFFGKRKLQDKSDFNQYNEESRDRLDEADRLENEIRKLCILLVNEYDKISWRSSQSKERIENVYKSLKGKKFMEDGKVLDFRAINEMNNQSYEIIKSKLDK